jgi:hypothetical protein
MKTKPRAGDVNKTARAGLRSVRGGLGKVNGEPLPPAPAVGGYYRAGGYGQEHGAKKMSGAISA